MPRRYGCRYVGLGQTCRPFKEGCMWSTRRDEDVYEGMGVSEVKERGVKRRGLTIVVE